MSFLEPSKYYKQIKENYATTHYTITIPRKAYELDECEQVPYLKEIEKTLDERKNITLRFNGCICPQFSSILLDDMKLARFNYDPYSSIIRLNIMPCYEEYEEWYYKLTLRIY